MSFSRDLLTSEASWGDPHATDSFSPADCWALRSGRPQSCSIAEGDVVCRHACAGRGATLCIPLTAQGEMVGVLNLVFEGAAASSAAADFAQTLSLTLANLRLKESMRNQATRDSLTGLHNRRFFDETLPRELARAARSSEPLALIVFDVDHFKRFNDMHGHAAGDALLKQLGVTLRCAFRDSDVVCRYGGEELVAILPQCTVADAVARAEAVRAAVREMVVTHDGALLGPISISAGVSATPDHGRNVEALFQAADRALYRSKADGRDRVTAASHVAQAAAA